MTADHSDGRPAIPGYTLMFTGQRAAKTALLRLLIDTLDIAPTATRAQTDSLAKFVMAANAQSPAALQAVTIDIVVPHPTTVQRPRSPRAPEAQDTSSREHSTHPEKIVQLTLIDTPAYECSSAQSWDLAAKDLLGFVEDRYRHTVANEAASNAIDQQVHLCIHLLDPDNLAPEPVFHSSQRMRPRHDADGDELIESDDDGKPSPNKSRPRVSSAELLFIRRLSARINILPVVARADRLALDQLEAVKKAVLTDLARERLGFGIFDPSALVRRTPSALVSSRVRGGPGEDHDSALPANRGRSTSHSSAEDANSIGLPLLPYALVTPDVYEWGTSARLRSMPSFDDLVERYSPSKQLGQRLAPGRFVRNYRWGTVDVLDPLHCDFRALHEAVFKHMNALKVYTRNHLYAKWKNDPANAFDPSERDTRAHSQLASAPHRHAQANGIAYVNFDANPDLPYETPGEYPGTLQYSLATGNSGVPKLRQKKILVACNFCRTRKLKCDGGRPACSQCTKRSNPCDYQPVVKRRGMAKSIWKENEEDGIMEEITASAASAATPAQSSSASGTSLPPLREELLRVAEKRGNSPSADEQFLRDARGVLSARAADTASGLPASGTVPTTPLIGAAYPASSSPVSGRATLPPINTVAAPRPHHSRSEAGFAYVDRERDAYRDRERAAQEMHERNRDLERQERGRERERAYVRERDRDRERDWDRTRELDARQMQRGEFDRRPSIASLSTLTTSPTSSTFSRTPFAHETESSSRPPILPPPSVLTQMHHRPPQSVISPVSSRGTFPELIRSPPEGLKHPYEGPHIPSFAEDPQAAMKQRSMAMNTIASIPTPDGAAIEPGNIVKKRRAASNYGPKTVACNFCRARKTKCDGQHPKCSNCVKRSLGCEYLEDQRRRGAHRPPPEGADGDPNKLKRLAPAPSVATAGLQPSAGPLSAGSSTTSRRPSTGEQQFAPIAGSPAPGHQSSRGHSGSSFFGRNSVSSMSSSSRPESEFTPLKRPDPMDDRRSPPPPGKRMRFSEDSTLGSASTPRERVDVIDTLPRLAPPPPPPSREFETERPRGVTGPLW